MSSDSQPLVSIGIPVYNESTFLRETIQSALEQSYTDIEILISDNGSDDDSVEVAMEMEKLDNRIKVFAHENNLGPFFNFNYLLNQAKGMYFMWLGAHDLMKPGYVKNAMEIFTLNPGTVAVCPKVVELLNGKEGDKLISPDYFVDPDTFSNRLLQIIRTTSRGSAVHSIFKVEVLKKSFVDINGGDLRIILTAASFGSIISTKDVALVMRTVRPIETSEEAKERYQGYGFSNDWMKKRYMFPFALISGNSKLSFKEKLYLIREMKPLIDKYGWYPYKEIFYFYLRKFKIRTALMILIVRFFIKD